MQRAIKIRTRVLGNILAILGVILLFFSISIDLIGFGEHSGFGPAQLISVIVSLIVISLGVLFFWLNKVIKLDIANFLLLCISMIFTVIIGEFFARYLLKAWPFEPNPRDISYLTQRDNNLRWRYPSGNGKNSLGLKNKEITTKEDIECRILFLGDSLVYLGETTSGELYTQAIERTLNKKLAKKNKRFDIINMGIPGYTTYQEVEFLKIYGLEMQPDLVILGFVFNDLHYKYIYRPTEENFFELDPEARLNRFDVHHFPGNLFAKSYLAHEAYFALDIVIKNITDDPQYPFEKKLDFYPAWKEHGWEKTKVLISEMQTLLKEKDIPLIVVIFPVTNQVDDAYLTINKDYVLYPQRRIKNILDELDILYLDLTHNIYINGGTKLYTDYVHLNQAGNDVVALEVTDFLINSASSSLNNCSHN